MVLKRSIIITGPFPPPLHGMAYVNAAMRDLIKGFGIEPITVDLSSKTLNRALFARIPRATNVLLGFIKILGCKHHFNSAIIYLSISGGYGQIYDILFIALARLLKWPIYLHHHSYAYLKKPSRITRLLITTAGKSATHISLCDDMAERLRHCYHNVVNVAVLSNASLIETNARPVRYQRNSLKRIGFLGNISESKGVFEFIDVMKSFSEERSKAEIHGLIAGPFEDAQVKSQVLSALKDLANVSYVGPKYRSEKEDFLRSIDVLLFPTKYANEADPLTIHEAMATGLPVIAWQRGCIRDIINPEAGFVIKQNEDFVKLAVERILLWAFSAEEYRRASADAYKQSIRLRAHYQEALDNLFSEMLISHMPRHRLRESKGKLCQDIGDPEANS